LRLHDIYLLPSRAKFVRECVDSGSFDSITEVVNEALGLLELRSENEEVRLCVLRAELQKGFDDHEAGRYITFESKEEMRRYSEERRRHLREQFAAEEESAGNTLGTREIQGERKARREINDDTMDA